MKLQEVARYYDRRRAEANPPPELGFQVERVGYVLRLTAEGVLSGVVPLGDEDPKTGKRRPVPMPVPRPLAGRTSGVRAYFLADNAKYLLGVGGGKPERDRETFAASKDKHLRYLEGCGDPHGVAVRRFFEQWEPERIAELADLPEVGELAAVNLVFRVEGLPNSAHDSPALRRIWQAHLAEENEAEEGQCLVTGAAAPIAMLHPAIKGVKGAQSSGAYLVSFNSEAFCSYSKGTAAKGLNAPVSQEAAFAYSTALNEMLAHGSGHRTQIGETSILFWAESPMPEEIVFGGLLDGGGSEEKREALDPQTRDRLDSALKRIRDGMKPSDMLDDLGKEVRFFILGLAAPSQARLTVRFWHETTMGRMLDGVMQHYRDLRIERRFDSEPLMPGLWRLVAETAMERKLDNAPPRIADGLMRAILNPRQAYPTALLSAVLGRIRAEIGKGGREDPVTYLRAALIKACLIRRERWRNPSQDMETTWMSLDEDSTDVPYRLGRLFAVLEKAQRDALGAGINRTIRDGYFATASASPRAVFPRLLRLAQHHISKADYGYQSDRRIAAIVDDMEVPKAFPARLDLEQQGRFVLGYYHQRNRLYRKTEAPAETAEAEEQETA